MKHSSKAVATSVGGGFMAQARTPRAPTHLRIRVPRQSTRTIYYGGGSPHGEPTATDIQRDLFSMLIDRIEKLDASIGALSERLGSIGIVSEAAELRELGEDEALREVKAYFEAHHGETIYPDEVARALQIDLMRAIDLCEKLVQEGKIAR